MLPALPNAIGHVRNNLKKKPFVGYPFAWQLPYANKMPVLNSGTGGRGGDDGAIACRKRINWGPAFGQPPPVVVIGPRDPTDNASFIFLAGRRGEGNGSGPRNGNSEYL